MTFALVIFVWVISFLEISLALLINLDVQKHLDPFASSPADPKATKVSLTTSFTQPLTFLIMISASFSEWGLCFQSSYHSSYAMKPQCSGLHFDVFQEKQSIQL